MERLSRSLKVVAVIGVVLGALSFGASQALAGAKVFTCDPPYYGTCASNAMCQKICDDQLPGSTGDCHFLQGVGCCSCFF